MRNLTGNQKKVIEDNYRAFVANFGEPAIESADYGGGFYVYYPAERAQHGDYIQYCTNIHYLDGWLYGVVQGHNRGEFKRGLLDG